MSELIRANKKAGIKPAFLFFELTTVLEIIVDSQTDFSLTAKTDGKVIDASRNERTEVGNIFVFSKIFTPNRNAQVLRSVGPSDSSTKVGDSWT